MVLPPTSADYYPHMTPWVMVHPSVCGVLRPIHSQGRCLPDVEALSSNGRSGLLNIGSPLSTLVVTK